LTKLATARVVIFIHSALAQLKQKHKLSVLTQIIYIDVSLVIKFIFQKTNLEKAAILKNLG
jgi:hypothetical protein